MRENNPTIRYVTAIVAVLLLCGLCGLCGLAAVSATADAVDADAGTRMDTGAEEAGVGAGSGVVGLRVAPRIFSGWGFDTCRTPATRTMRAWLRSDYRAVGVYYAGLARHCRKQPNLTPGWVRSTDRMGWRLLPIYVGSQSPCAFNKAKRKYRISRGHPWRQGRAEARDAVARAARLGFAQGSPLYLDMEAYSVVGSRCTAPVLSFVRAWNRQLRESGYLPGFYSSSDSGIAHMGRARAAGIPDMPSVIWYARWRVPPTLRREPMLSPRAWQPHRRIHQYLGNVRERHGGRQLHIDRNRMDAPVAIVSG
jgi:hypothetical protein